MTYEEIQAKKAKDRMLAMNSPRTKEGLIIPILPTDRPMEHVMLPFRENSHGQTSPAEFPEAYMNGKTPDYIQYREGSIIPNPNIESVNPALPLEFQYTFKYDDPQYNLSPQQRQALVVGEMIRNSFNPLQTILNCCDHRATGNTGAVHSPEYTPADSPSDFSTEGFSQNDEVYPLHGRGLYCDTRNGATELANWIPVAREKCIIHGSRYAEEKVEFRIEVLHRGKGTQLRISVDELDQVIRKVQQAIPSARVSAGIVKANALIINYIRDQLDDVPTRLYLEKTGFQKLDSQWIYVHDGQCTIPGVVYQTGRTIPCNPAVPLAQSFLDAIEFISISSRSELIVPLFVFAHTGPLFQLFEAAESAPRFLLFLNGRTGSLKTSLSMALFRLYAQSPTTPAASFKDTATALEIKLGEANGSVLLVDDFHPAASTTDGKKSLEILEFLIRSVGDQVAKARSNCRLGKAQEFRPSGTVIVTGEDTGGSQSSALRYLSLTIRPDDVSGQKLRRFQENPLILQTYFANFLGYCGQAGEEIITYIRESKEPLRAACRTQIHELRLVDAAVIMLQVSHLILLYGRQIGALGDATYRQMEDLWGRSILTAFAASEHASRGLNPVFMYLQALYDLYEQGDICLAGTPADYRPDIHLGYIDGEEIWYKERDAFPKVTAFWRRFDSAFPLTSSKIKAHLADAGLLIPAYEGSKKLYARKSKTENHTRMLVLARAAAKEYLERQSTES